MSNRSRTELIDAVNTAARRHHAAYSSFNQALAERVGLHPTDLQCVSLLTLEPGPHTIGAIAERTGLTSGSATRLVDRLERAGLVERRADPQDRRKMLVSLTAERISAVDAAWENPGRAFNLALDDFTATELETIERYLLRITDVGNEQAKALSGSVDEDRRT
ncbi:DNA-binding MarR family transcriptional regulator [Promicromonospora sp. AC04]|uniref:MarR family winged helix-turn-helix transcriptional regulator n=1 Tax=Promicromonospora sp. AC04 TaxID=2135723 RepID=UPI000D3735BF|nr:MarR family transcriptional regulator [Promicromonospora sp. AC04]PUB24795.1 DNA-binding MarR family transcriptional regulator [Promicromonospora sp. AC04]